MKIYLVHPISGLTPEEVFTYYKTTEDSLLRLGYEVLTPMYGKKILRTEVAFREKDYTMPCSTNHALFNRDRWMVEQADILYANLSSSKAVSIGSTMELAWGSLLRKHVVATLPEVNVHRHAFILEACSVIYPTHEESMEYLRTLIKKEY
jgi:nucleoside 2-deoxyribosyltransferase